MRITKESESGDNENDQKIYAYMTWMYGNDNIPGRYFGNIFSLTNWILDSGSTCHMTPQVSDFIPGSLEDTDKYIADVDGYHITA